MPENACFVLRPAETGKAAVATPIRLRRLLDGTFPPARVAVETEVHLQWFPSYLLFHCRCGRPDLVAHRGAASATDDEVSLWFKPRGRPDLLRLRVSREGGCTIARSPAEEDPAGTALEATWEETRRTWSATVRLPFALVSRLVSAESAPALGEVWRGNLLRRLRLPEGPVAYAWRPDYGEDQSLWEAGNLIFLAPELFS